MNNLFQTWYDKETDQSKGEYDSFIIRRTSKSQERKLKELSQSIKIKEKNGIPKWLYWLNRIAFSLLMVSFIFLIIGLITASKDNNTSYLKESLWMIIVFGISIVLFILSIAIAFILKKKKQKQNPKEASKDLFSTILAASKRYLSIPAKTASLEILMEQRSKSSKKIKKYTNVLLTVFIENDMLCLADLYVVIGIPLKSLGSFEIIKEPYQFSYWHKKNTYKDYGVEMVSVPVRCYQKGEYAILKINHSPKDLAIFMPEYEVEAFKKILEEKRD